MLIFSNSIEFFCLLFFLNFSNNSKSFDLPKLSLYGIPPYYSFITTLKILLSMSSWNSLMSSNLNSSNLSYYYMTKGIFFSKEKLLSFLITKCPFKLVVVQYPYILSLLNKNASYLIL